MCQVWCSGIAGIYAQLGGLICHGHMSIVLYLKLVWCNGFTDIYASLEVGGVNLPWVYVYCAIYEFVWCNGFPDTYDWLGRMGVASICHRYMCIVLYISVSRSTKFGILVCKASLLKSGGSICHKSMLHHHTPCQLTIDPCYTITPPLPIDHRSMLHHYTP